MNTIAASPVGRSDVADGDEPGSPPEPEPEPSRSHPPRPGVVEVVDRTARMKDDSLRWIEAHLADAAAHLPRDLGAVTVMLVDDAIMTAMHERYCGERSTTDVLTFELGDPAPAPIEGEIAICIDEAHRQASARGHSVEREILLCAVHGLLHCCGHDDHDPARSTAMHAEEDRILHAIGVGATFNSGDSTRCDDSGHDDAVALRHRDMDKNQ